MIFNFSTKIRFKYLKPRKDWSTNPYSSSRDESISLALEKTIKYIRVSNIKIVRIRRLTLQTNGKILAESTKNEQVINLVENKLYYNINSIFYC